MRAAKAAKDLQEVIASLASLLEDVTTTDCNGSGVEYISHGLLPFLKLVCAEVIAAKPVNPCAYTAVWLLQQCCAPQSLITDARAWITGEKHIANPTIKLPNGDSPKEKRPLKKAREFISNGSQGVKQVLIWKGADEDSDEPDDKAESLDEGSNVANVFVRRRRGSCPRPSMRLDDRKKRFTQSYNVEDVPPPPLEDLIEILRPVPVLKDLSEENLATVAGNVKCKRYQADDNVIVCNSMEQDLHVILNGTALISVPHEVGTLAEGKCFGNLLLEPTCAPSMQQISAFAGPLTTIQVSAVDFESLGLKNHFVEKCGKERVARNFAHIDESTSSNNRSVIDGICQCSLLPVDVGYVKTDDDRELVKNAVKRNTVLGEVLTLVAEQYDMIADAVYLINVPRDTVVLRMGDRGNALFIVQEGHMDVTIDDNLQGEFTIRTGDAFGELGLLYDAPRSATVSAATDCKLWVLPRYEFQVAMRMNYCSKVAVYTSMLLRIPCLQRLVDAAHMDVVAGVVEEISLLENEELCASGEDVGVLFLVLEGEAKAAGEGGDIRTLKTGDWIGEAQLENNLAASETVKVTSPVAIVLCLDMSRVHFANIAIKRAKAIKLGRAPRTRGSTVDANKLADVITKANVCGGILKKRVKKALALHRKEKLSSQPDLMRLETVGGLGEGSFGLVYLMRDTKTEQMSALKVVSKQHIIHEKLGDMMKNERNIMMLLDSKFIVHLYQTYQDAQHIYLLMEAVVGGELFDVYHRCEMYGNLPNAKFYIGCVTLALQHMHSQRVIYRDLKLENCLVGLNGYLKLTDMGVAKVIIGKSYTVCGTADYFAPEILRQLGHNRGADWWACGVLLFIMCSGRSPFDAPEVQQIYKNIIRGFSKVRFPSTFPSDLVDVIKSLCRKAPEERVTMQKGGVENLMEMPFFAKFDWEGLGCQTFEAPYMPPAVDLEQVAAKKLTRALDIKPEELDIWDGVIRIKSG